MNEKSGRCSAESQPAGTSVIMKARKEHRASKLREPGKGRERDSLWMTCPASAYSSALCCVVLSRRTRCAYRSSG